MMVVGLAAQLRERLGPPPSRDDWPRVSLVVVNRDGVRHLRRLLEGLVATTDYPDLELILVDNASSDESVAFMRTAAAPFPIAIVRNAHNESFSDANNRGAVLATGELLLFLNNDVEPFEPGWLKELVACREASGSGVVGATLLERAADGDVVVQQRGIRISRHEQLPRPVFRDRGAPPLGPGLGEDVESAGVSGACLLIGRELFAAVGGFAHGYLYGGEDSDLTLSVRARGLRTICSGRSFALHPAGSTLGATDPAVRRRWLIGNRRLLWERWGPRLWREYELDLLDGSGVWAEANGAPPVADADRRARIEALGFCLHEGMGDDAEAGWGDALATAADRRGHRCLVLRGAKVGELAALDYDVVVHVHVRGAPRHVPNPRQVTVLWCVDAEPSAAERARYDLVAGPSITADALVSAAKARAADLGYATRIGPRERVASPERVG